jgi:hypothetical protein
MFGVLTKADKTDNLPTVLHQNKTALADLNCEQFFATSALAGIGVEEPFAAAAEIFTKKDCASSPRNLKPAESGACC